MALKIVKSANPEKEEDSGFQNYDIIIFKCPVLNNNNNQKAYKETGKYSPLKETKLIDRNSP